MSDIETRLTTLLRERSDGIDFDPAEWRARVEDARGRRGIRPYAVALAALAAAASVVGAVVWGWHDGQRVAPPATTSPVTQATRPTLAGTWRAISVDGLDVDPHEILSIAFADSGWWRAQAGCVVVGSRFTWNPADGMFAAADWSPKAGTMPPKNLADCYQPAILAVVRPGTHLVPAGNEIVARDAQGREFARLVRIDGEPTYAAPALPADATWRVSGVANPTAASRPWVDLGVSLAPWLRVSTRVQGSGFDLTLVRPAGSGPECRLARVSGTIDASGALAAVRTDDVPQTTGGGACTAYGLERRSIAAVLTTRFVAGDRGGVYLLGDRGTVAMQLGSEDGSGTAAPAVVLDPAEVGGAWWPTDPTGAGLTVFLGRDVHDDLAISVTDGACGTSRTLTLDTAGEVTRNTATTPRPTCTVGAGIARLDSLLSRASRLLVFGGRLTIETPRGAVDLDDAPPTPAATPAGDIALLSRYAAPADLLGRWRLDWVRTAPTRRSWPGDPGITFAQTGHAMVRVTFLLCNSARTDVALTADAQVLGMTNSMTTAVLCQGDRGNAEGAVWEAPAFGFDTQGRLVVVSRSGVPLIAFTRVS